MKKLALATAAVLALLSIAGCANVGKARPLTALEGYATTKWGRAGLVPPIFVVRYPSPTAIVALPLPTFAQPAMLRRASTAAVARASFFMKETPPLS